MGTVKTLLQQGTIGTVKSFFFAGHKSEHLYTPKSPQQLLPLISTVTTATTSKSGSREPNLFFSLLFLKQNTYYYFSFLSLNYYAL